MICVSGAEGGASSIASIEDLAAATRSSDTSTAAATAVRFPSHHISSQMRAQENGNRCISHPPIVSKWVQNQRTQACSSVGGWLVRLLNIGDRICLSDDDAAVADYGCVSI